MISPTHHTFPCFLEFTKVGFRFPQHASNLNHAVKVHGDLEGHLVIIKEVRRKVIKVLDIIKLACSEAE